MYYLLHLLPSLINDEEKEHKLFADLHGNKGKILHQMQPHLSMYFMTAFQSKQPTLLLHVSQTLTISMVVYFMTFPYKIGSGLSPIVSDNIK